VTLFILRIRASIFYQTLRAVAHAVCHRPFTAAGGGSIRDEWRTESNETFFSFQLLTFSAVSVLLVLLTRSVIIIETIRAVIQ
jgi:hypothetical protein